MCEASAQQPGQSEVQAMGRLLVWCLQSCFGNASVLFPVKQAGPILTAPCLRRTAQASCSKLVWFCPLAAGWDRKGACSAFTAACYAERSIHAADNKWALPFTEKCGHEIARRRPPPEISGGSRWCPKPFLPQLLRAAALVAWPASTDSSAFALDYGISLPAYLGT